MRGGGCCDAFVPVVMLECKCRCRPAAAHSIHSMLARRCSQPPWSSTTTARSQRQAQPAGACCSSLTSGCWRITAPLCCPKPPTSSTRVRCASLPPRLGVLSRAGTWSATSAWRSRWTWNSTSSPRAGCTLTTTSTTGLAYRWGWQGAACCEECVRVPSHIITAAAGSHGLQAASKAPQLLRNPMRRLADPSRPGLVTQRV